MVKTTIYSSLTVLYVNYLVKFAVCLVQPILRYLIDEVRFYFFITLVILPLGRLR